MTTQSQILTQLSIQVGVDIKDIRNKIGTLPNLTTTEKTSLVGAINELDAKVASLQNATAINDSTNASTTETYSVTKILSSIQNAVNALKNDLVNGAGSALDTFKELADAINNDSTFAQTLALGLGKKVDFSQVQSLTLAEKLQARTNIGAVGLADIGDTSTDFVAQYNAAKNT